jgi:ribosome biogenesis GTPase / thiamine phosphate phosphatase
MGSKRRKPRTTSNSLTEQYGFGEFDDAGLDETDVPSSQRFSDRNKHAQQNKTLHTTQMRAAEAAAQVDPETLPVGQVRQVYSRFCEVEHDGRMLLCVVRKTLNKVSASQLVVGDLVRFREGGTKDESGRPEAVIEQVLPRQTVLTRADSFRQTVQHPIVANAEQMLIVASVSSPRPKWGLIDRMIVAARSGGLTPIICLNKIDLPRDGKIDPLEAVAYYRSIGLATVSTSVEKLTGIAELREILKDHTTVLAGHSGVGKSSLISAIEPGLDIRIGAISNFNDKGRHTTSSARRYALSFGGAVIDTPGVKVFGLWGVTRENLLGFFPDVEAEAAPKWRLESFHRIEADLP